MQKIIYSLGLLCVLNLILVSCATSSAEPDYLIKAKSDNGFVTAYQAHFAISSDSITQISARRYDDLTLGADSNYKMINATTYAFDITAASPEPAEWEYVQNEYDTKSYDVPSLIKSLRQMNIRYTGTIYVLVTTFDDYTVIEAANLDRNTVLDESYAIFKNNKLLEHSDELRLSQLWRFYRHK